MFVSGHGDVSQVLGWVVAGGNVGSNDEPLVLARCEYCRDGVGGDRRWVFDVPIVGVGSPEECYAAFTGAGCTRR